MDNFKKRSSIYTPIPTNDSDDYFYEGTADRDATSADEEMGNNNNTERTVPLEDDPEMEGLSLYEKKAFLVNRDLDDQGMGRYQWCIFALCGFGYFLDLLWAQAFALIVPPMQQEFGFSDLEYGNIFSAFSAGLTAGAFVWGFLVDIIGRYWAFNFTVLWSSIFGLVLGVPNSYNVVIVLSAFIGIGIGGNIPIDTTICLECLPHNRRWLLPALSVFQPIGVVVCSLICYGFIPNYSCATDLLSCNSPELKPGEQCCTKASNYGWRYAMFTLGGITLLAFVARFLCFRFQESPKYLLYKGQDEKAIESLQYIAKFNSRHSAITLDTFAALSDKRTFSLSQGSSTSSAGNSGADRTMLERRVSRRSSNTNAKPVTAKERARVEIKRYKMFFASPALIRLTLLLWAIYAFDYWGFTIAGSFLPKILAKKGTDLGMTTGDTYRSYVYIYLFGIPGVLLGASIYGWRRLSMIFSSALFGASLFIFTAVHDQASYIGINGLVYFFQSMFNAILYGITPELFPAPIRGTASGVSSFWGRLFSIVAPLIAARVLAESTNGVLYLAGAGGFMCTILIVFLPKSCIDSENL